MLQRQKRLDGSLAPMDEQLALAEMIHRLAKSAKLDEFVASLEEEVTEAVG